MKREALRFPQQPGAPLRAEPTSGSQSPCVSRAVGMTMRGTGRRSTGPGQASGGDSAGVALEQGWEEASGGPRRMGLVYLNAHIK